MKEINRKWLVITVLILVAFVWFTYLLNIRVQMMLYPRKYAEYVEKYAAEFSVPEYIVYSVVKVESDFDSFAQSEKGACGLMQLMPKTYEWLAELLDEAPKDIFDAEENIKYGTYYLGMLYERYNDWTIALCAYNAGMGNVDKWLEADEFVISFSETQFYVNKLEVVMGKYKSLYYGKGVKI